MASTLLSPPRALGCPPRFGTERTPGRATLGPAVGEVARLLGKPLMPWQQHVADVALELLDDGSFAYDEVGLTVPRQSGKSTLILAKATHRASATGFFGRRQTIVYTAQTRIKAREKWEEDYADTLEHASAFPVKVHKSNGNEHIRFPNQSRFGIDAATEKAGHGGTVDEAYIDEAFAQVDSRLEQAFRPAMITRRNKQLWVVSTAGWKGASPLLEAKVKRGRAAVEAGKTTGGCYFEWSAPEGADPFDRDVWRACMPALGHTITEAAIEAELEAFGDNLNEFRRAYLNQWVDRASPDFVIDMDRWSSCGDTGSSIVGPLVFAVDMTPDRRRTSIAVCGERSDGVLHVEVVDNRPGSSWVVDRAVELAAHEPKAFVVDPGSPAGSLIPGLTEAGIEVSECSVRELTQACGGFHDDAFEGVLRHIDQAPLNRAVENAKKRPVGDAWAWARKDATTDISPLVAVTLARFGFIKWRGDAVEDDEFPIAAVWA